MNLSAACITDGYTRNTDENAYIAQSAYPRVDPLRGAVESAYGMKLGFGRVS